MFSLYVLLCQVVQGKCVILQNTDECLGQSREEVLAGSPFPQRLSQAREVRCFSMLCVGDDQAPLTTGSLFVFQLVLLCPLVFEAFLQSKCTLQTQIPQVCGSS